MHLGLTLFLTGFTITSVSQNSPRINESWTCLAKLENVNPATHTGEQVSWCVCRGRKRAHSSRISHWQKVFLHHLQSGEIFHQSAQLRTDGEIAVYLKKPVMKKKKFCNKTQSCKNKCMLYLFNLFNDINISHFYLDALKIWLQSCNVYLK
jgi:hypothetical protein